MTFRTLVAVFAIGLCTDLLAEEKQEFPQVSFSWPGANKNPTPINQYIILVIEGPTLSYEANPIASGSVVEYVNKLLEVKKVSYIAVYTREGTKYGDVVNAIDVLRGTKAKNIGLSTKEIPPGHQP